MYRRGIYLTLFAGLSLICSCGTKVNEGKPLSQAEVQQFFQERLKSDTEGKGHSNPHLVITRFHEDEPSQYFFGNSIGVKTCYTITMDYFEAEESNHTTYINTKNNFQYRLYRDESGNLAIGDHTNGTTTVQELVHKGN